MAKTVILANGSFPKKGGPAWNLLCSAKRVVACDGAANTFIRRFRRAPDFIVGDLDSIKVNSKGEKGKSKDSKNPQLFTLHSSLFTLIPDQSTNDLSKAISFCRKRGWRDLVILGAAGKREDHMLGNIFRAMEAGIEVVTDYGRFIPSNGLATASRPFVLSESGKTCPFVLPESNKTHPFVLCESGKMRPLPDSDKSRPFFYRAKVVKGTPISVFATDKRAKMASKGLEWPLKGVKFNNLYCATLNRTVANVVEITSNSPFFIYIAT